MAVITIDQKTYEVDQQKNLLEVALCLGLDLPYFCWHPSLGSVGSCRLCAVQQFADESDQNGRTVMACMTQAKENSRFSISHPTCSGFRKNVTEWLMINHPHDCPVCDEGGECHLQDMTLMSGQNYRRYRFAKRTFRNQNLGSFINHEMNRCITCYRCVRFYQDMAGGHDLSAFSSSGRVYFGRFADGPLESEFSGNLVEICPTGVFTDKTYHQRYVRKWDLSTAPSVCQLCSVGCNISPGERGGVLRRVQNRFHQDINGYFLCDRGRFGHEFVNVKDRPLQPVVKGKHGSSYDDTIAHVGKLIRDSRRIVGIGSPRASLEANWMLKKVVGDENFYDGLSRRESRVMRQVMDVFYERAVDIASQQDIRQADAIIILGEDVTNTAPRTALSIREAQLGYKRKKLQEDLNIPGWNDAAVKDYARDHNVPIYIAHSFRTALDPLAKSHCIVHPFLLKKIAFSLLQFLQNGEINEESSEIKSFLEQVRATLLVAKNPVIIAGSSLGDEDLIRLSFAIARVCDLKNHGQTKLSVIVPEANSVGLSMLAPRLSADDLIFSDTSDEIDVAIVLENDFKWRLGSKPFQNFCKRVKNLVVIDSLYNDTAKMASIFLPSLNFLETTGTFVSAEGRIQRFFSVKPSPKKEIAASFRILSGMKEELAQKWANVDDICQALAQDLGFSSQVCEQLFTKDFNVDGQKIPRQTSEYSGRTALLANVTMHEPKPASDQDSPFVFSMEGARNKIPLPLISTSWAPSWNSVQSSFKTNLRLPVDQKDVFGGVRLFSKIKAPKENADVISISYSEIDCRRVYVIPQHHIFGSSEIVNFSPSLSSRLPPVVAYISEQDAKKSGFCVGASLVLNTSVGKFSVFVEMREDVPEGILLLPFGLVDASLFFENCTIHAGNEERV